MGAAPLSWLAKIGGDMLKTKAKLLSSAINELYDDGLKQGDTVGLDYIKTATADDLKNKVPEANAVKELNSNLNEKTYYDVRQLGITSWFIPDIIKAMPNYSRFMCDVGTGISSVADNKLPLSLGIVSIEKTASRYRVIYNYSSDSSVGQIYIASVNVTDSIVNGWYQLNVTAV